RTAFQRIVGRKIAASDQWNAHRPQVPGTRHVEECRRPATGSVDLAWIACRPPTTSLEGQRIRDSASLDPRKRTHTGRYLAEYGGSTNRLIEPQQLQRKIQPHPVRVRRLETQVHVDGV